jgi:HEPN domain-containing protein
MSLQDHVRYWVDSANADWSASQSLLENKHLLHAMFFIHLSLEKLLKANWVLDNGESFPPMTHNLENLYSQTELELEANNIDLLKLINTWNIEGRYQDYRNKLARSYTEEYLHEKLLRIETVRKCLLERLP